MKCLLKHKISISKFYGDIILVNISVSTKLLLTTVDVLTYLGSSWRWVCRDRVSHSTGQVCRASVGMTPRDRSNQACTALRTGSPDWNSRYLSSTNLWGMTGTYVEQIRTLNETVWPKTTTQGWEVSRGGGGWGTGRGDPPDICDPPPWNQSYVVHPSLSLQWEICVWVLSGLI